MGLRHCFSAESRLWYRLHPRGEPLPLQGLGIGYNDALVAAPRLYDDEIPACVPSKAGGYAYGGLWVGSEQNAHDTTTIHYANLVHSVDGFSGWLAHWTLDGMYGRPALHPWADGGGGAIDGGNGLTLHGRISSGGVARYTFEPTGRGSGLAWEYGYLGDGVQAYVLDPLTMEPSAALGSMDAQWFKQQDGVSPVTIGNCFAISRVADRMFVQTEADQREISIYRWSTRQYLTSIYAPNSCYAIVLTAEGFCYLADARDWILLYDFDGVYQNAFRNARREQYLGMYGGLCYGWDGVKKRLLAVGMRENSQDGQCRCRVEGYYPIVEPAGLAPPIPRNVPRKDRTIYFASRLYGEGGEPLGGRHITATADPLALTLNTPSTVTDQRGEVNIQATCLATGAQAINVTADATIPEPPAPEPQPEPGIVGRTLLVEITWPKPRSKMSNTNWQWTFGDGALGTKHGPPMPLYVQVTGAAGACRVQVYKNHDDLIADSDSNDPELASVVHDLGGGLWMIDIVIAKVLLSVVQFTAVVTDKGDPAGWNYGQDGRTIVTFGWGDPNGNEVGPDGPT